MFMVFNLGGFLVAGPGMAVGAGGLWGIYDLSRRGDCGINGI